MDKVINSKEHKNAAVITAAGSSSRLGLKKKKEFLPLFKFGKGVSVLSQSLFSFLNTKLFNFIVITAPKYKIRDTEELLFKDERIKTFMEQDSKPCLIFAEGGETRQLSVLNGLKALKKAEESTKENIGFVFVHDGARPFVSEKLIRNIAEAVFMHGAAVPGISITDTPKIADKQGKIICHPNREALFLVQTPQAFNFKNLYNAHIRASNSDSCFTDDSSIYAKYYSPVFICEGEKSNIKITFKEDLKFL